MKKELMIFDAFIRSKGHRHTVQRERVLKTFLATESHVSVEELCKLVKKQDKTIGYTTVYRAMKLFSESGLCGEVDFGDGTIRFEHKYGHEHHDHLICIKCGNFVEVVKPQIEQLQENLAKAHGFITVGHKLQIFGICKKCRKG